MADDSRPIDLTGQNDPAALVPKVMHAGTEPVGQPYLLVTETGLTFVGDKRKVISIGPDFGVSITGFLSLSAMPEQISVGGGYWRVNPMVLSVVPSTTPTPVPWLVKSTPRLLQASSDIDTANATLEASSDIPV